jgi:hypothetical protein
MFNLILMESLSIFYFGTCCVIDGIKSNMKIKYLRVFCVLYRSCSKPDEAVNNKDRILFANENLHSRRFRIGTL